MSSSQQYHAPEPHANGPPTVPLPTPMPPFPSPVELRKLPREQQEAILGAAAELMEQEYRTNKDLTNFEAFAEEP